MLANQQLSEEAALPRTKFGLAMLHFSAIIAGNKM